MPLHNAGKILEYFLSGMCHVQALFEGVVTTLENGGKKAPFTTQLGYTKEQIEVIQRLKNSKSDYERLGLSPGASKWVLVCGCVDVVL